MATISTPRTREAVLEVARRATKSYVSTDVTIEINGHWCRGCSICVELCPNHVLKMTAAPSVLTLL